MSSIQSADASERYQDRPDPSEPWRYECPDCGSVCIHTNTGTHISNTVRGEPRAGRQWGFTRESPPDYRCQNCGTGIDNDELVDRRADDE